MAFLGAGRPFLGSGEVFRRDAAPFLSAPRPCSGYVQPVTGSFGPDVEAVANKVNELIAAMKRSE